MFNNANVLYRTSFVDGNSKVDRVELKNKSMKNKKSLNNSMYNE